MNKANKVIRYPTSSTVHTTKWVNNRSIAIGAGCWGRMLSEVTESGQFWKKRLSSQVLRNLKCKWDSNHRTKREFSWVLSLSTWIVRRCSAWASYATGLQQQQGCSRAAAAASVEGCFMCHAAADSAADTTTAATTTTTTTTTTTMTTARQSTTLQQLKRDNDNKGNRNSRQLEKPLGKPLGNTPW